MSEIKFSVEDKDYYIVAPGAKIVSQAQRAYTKAFRLALENGAPLKKMLDKHMREQGLWDDKKEQEYRDLAKRLADCEFKLSKGGIKVSEAKDIAINLKHARRELQSLIQERSLLDANTAEGQAEQDRFNYLVSACIYDSLTRKPVFSSVQEYVEREDAIAEAAAKEFAHYMYGISKNFESELTENKFLKRFGFIDDKNRLINKDNQLVDEEGHLVDEEGYRIDSEGNRVDINNNPILKTTVDDAEFILD